MLDLLCCPFCYSMLALHSAGNASMTYICALCKGKVIISYHVDLEPPVAAIGAKGVWINNVKKALLRETEDQECPV